MNDRLDLYRNVHKGIRVMLFDIVQKSGRTDFTDPSALAALRTSVADVFELLESHAHTEDAHVMPIVRKAAPALADEFDEAHEDQEARLPGLLAALERIDPAAPDAAARGHRIVLQISRIAGELLTHMADEELELNPVIWNNTTEEELHAVEQNLVASIPPEKMGRYLRWMIPAMNPRERVQFAELMPPGPRQMVEQLIAETAVI